MGHRTGAKARLRLHSSHPLSGLDTDSTAYHFSRGLHVTPGAGSIGPQKVAHQVDACRGRLDDRKVSSRH